MPPRAPSAPIWVPRAVSLHLGHIDHHAAAFLIDDQVKAIADNIEFEVKMKGDELPLHTEGKQNSVWVLVDYFDTVVHVFHHEAREYYGLEKLWSDGKVTEYQNL